MCRHLSPRESRRIANDFLIYIFPYKVAPHGGHTIMQAVNLLTEGWVYASSPYLQNLSLAVVSRHRFQSVFAFCSPFSLALQTFDHAF